MIYATSQYSPSAIHWICLSVLEYNLEIHGFRFSSLEDRGSCYEISRTIWIVYFDHQKPFFFAQQMFWLFLQPYGPICTHKK